VLHEASLKYNTGLLVVQAGKRQGVFKCQQSDLWVREFWNRS